MQDPITDMLNRIRNAQAVFKPQAAVPFSKIKYEIAKILEKEGFISAVERKGRKAARVFEIVLKYKKAAGPSAGSSAGTIPKIQGLKRISKPGKRIYLGSKELKPVLAGYGIAVISTPQGLMTDKEARKKKLGGEVLCEVW